MKREQASTPEQLRVAVFWTDLAGYILGSLQALTDRLGDRAWCGFVGPSSPLLQQEPYSRLPIHPYTPPMTPPAIEAAVLRELTAFKPDVLFTVGWSVPPIPRVAAAMKRQGVLTVCMADTPWLGTARQTVRCLLGRRMIHQWYDALCIPGAMGMPVARVLGFDGPTLWQNQYTAESPLYAAGTAARLEAAHATRQWPRQFVFVGRLVSAKNVQGLLEAYARYRRLVADPWPLTIIGDGPLRSHVTSAPHVTWLGWRSGPEIAAVMAESGAFVLPSHYEPWGVVAHEASCAGLPLVLSTRVGAGADLLRDGYNGRLVEATRPEHLAEMLRWVSQHPTPWVLGARSFALSQQFSPDQWADYLLQRSCELLAWKRDRAGGHG